MKKSGIEDTESPFSMVTINQDAVDDIGNMIMKSPKRASPESLRFERFIHTTLRSLTINLYSVQYTTCILYTVHCSTANMYNTFMRCNLFL